MLRSETSKSCRHAGRLYCLVDSAREAALRGLPCDAVGGGQSELGSGLFAVGSRGFVYDAIPEMTPKMMLTIPGATHFSWFGPGDAGGGLSGQVALAFQKVFLEGDERWKPLPTMPLPDGMVQTNIK
jgi:hypothetical protein